MENINDENINNENIIVIIKKLLEKGDIERVSRIMTNFAIIERIDKKIYYVLQKMINNSKYKEQIDSLIRGMLGIFG